MCHTNTTVQNTHSLHEFCIIFFLCFYMSVRYVYVSEWMSLGSNILHGIIIIIIIIVFFYGCARSHR